MPEKYFALFFLAIPLLILAINLVHFLRRRKLAKQNYEWYCRQYPAYVNKGKVRCHHCNHHGIAVRSMMQRSFLLAHICTQCGMTLYHSKEKKI